LAPNPIKYLRNRITIPMKSQHEEEGQTNSFTKMCDDEMKFHVQFLATPYYCAQTEIVGPHLLCSNLARCA